MSNEALPQTDEMYGGCLGSRGKRIIGRLRLGKETDKSDSVMWPHKADI
jgi:hypothetical protein